MEREAERRMNVLELGGQYHDRYGEKSMHAQREALSTMVEPSRGVVLDGSLGEPETVRPRVAASAKRTTGLPDSGSTRAGMQGLEALIWMRQKRTVLCSRREGPTTGSPVGEGESRSWKGRADDMQHSLSLIHI